MILWSIQSPEAWSALQSAGVLRCDAQMVDEEFMPAYHWMSEQMRQRLRNQPGERRLPLWAWYQWNGSSKKRPDLRFSAHLAPGEKGVRIEFEQDEMQVLLSDYELWHYALNYWYLPASIAKGDAFENELAKRGSSFYTTQPLADADYHGRITKSWERIFDLDWEEKDIASPREQKAIQASFWELSLDQVRRVDEFVAR